MTSTVNGPTPERVRRRMTASLSLSLVRLAPDRDEGLELPAFRRICGDTLLGGQPPYGLLRDLLRLVMYFDEAWIDPRPLADPELDRAYRIGVLYRLLREDSSVSAVARVARARGPADRRRFAAFLARELAQAIGSFAPLPWDVAGTHVPAAASLERDPEEDGDGELARLNDVVLREIDCLKALILCWPSGRDLLSDEQVTVLTYLRDERDVMPLRKYHAARAGIAPVDVQVSRRARRRPSRPVEVTHRTGAAVGGYSGIDAGGSADHIGRILPSEFARMEPDEPIDTFDLDLLEGRLLTFQRAHYLDVRPARRHVIVLWNLAALDFLPLWLPARWQLLMLAVVFDLVRFHRSHPTLAADTFDLVLCGDGPVAGAARLCEVVRRQDFPAAHITVHQLSTAELGGWYESIPPADRGQISLVEIAIADDEPSPPPPELHIERVRLRTDGVDVVTVGDAEGVRIEVGADCHDVDAAMTRIRDALLFASVAAATADVRPA